MHVAEGPEVGGSLCSLGAYMPPGRARHSMENKTEKNKGIEDVDRRV